MRSTREFFAAVNAFWLEEYHVDGFRYDHVNGYLDRKPVEGNEGIKWYSQENRPTFESLRELSRATYRESKSHSRFMPAPNAPSRIIQIAEDLRESAYQLSPVSESAINGCWEKRLADVAKNMAVEDTLSVDLGKELLLSDRRFDDMGYTGEKLVGDESILALVVQFIESHDERRLFYLMQHRKKCEEKCGEKGGEEGGEKGGTSGFEYRNGLDGEAWWKLQPYAIALMTSVGIPMLWAGQEFAENTGLAESGMVRVRGLRPLHWDYFYNAEAIPGGATVLPLVSLYRKLGKLRKEHPALLGPRENAKEEYCNPAEGVLVFRRWAKGEVLLIALNFSGQARDIPVPFGHAGVWVDVLEASYDKSGEAYSISVADSDTVEQVPVPGSFGRILRLQL